VIEPKIFTEAMKARWLAWNPVVSPELSRVWTRFFKIFNEQAFHADGSPRPVIPAELGAGKTTAAKIWCAHQPYESHPGVLVVVRLIEQAEEFAADVNAWSGMPMMAFAYHSGLSDAAKANLDALAQYPVLVICHRGYGLALDPLSLVDYSGRFDAVHRYRGKRRALCIVDEALEQVHEARLSRSHVAEARAKIPVVLVKKHLGALDVLESVERALILAPDDEEHAITADDLLARVRVGTPEADARLVALWGDLKTSNRIRPDNRAFVREALEAVRHHLAAPRWTAPGGIHGPEAAAMIGGKLLLPPEAALVVLDATGRLNTVYKTSPMYQVVNDLERVRRYDNLTVRVHRTKGTGLVAMKRRGEEIARQMLDMVTMHYGDRASERRVLVVTDLGSEDIVRAAWACAPFAQVDVAHWYALDGRNEWADFDTLVALTLPYGSPSFDLTTYLLTHNTHLLDTDPADVRAVRERRMAALIAQAIGRVEVRRMTSEDGACDPADVWLRMPNWDRVVNTDTVLGHLREELIGVRVEDVESTARKVRTPVRHLNAEAAIREAATRLTPAEPSILLATVCPGLGRSTVYRAVKRVLAGTGAVVRGERLELGLEARARALPAGVTVREAAEVLRVGYRKAAALLARSGS
jgi:hypothetical protein